MKWYLILVANNWALININSCLIHSRPSLNHPQCGHPNNLRDTINSYIPLLSKASEDTPGDTLRKKQYRQDADPWDPCSATLRQRVSARHRGLPLPAPPARANSSLSDHRTVLPGIHRLSGGVRYWFVCVVISFWIKKRA